MQFLTKAAACGLSLFVGPAFAATVTIQTDDTTQYTTANGISGFTSTGASLANAVFVATFADGSSETGTFAAFNRSTAGVSTTNVDVVQTGTTYSNAFSVTNYGASSLTSLSIDLMNASGIFDLTFGGEIGTVGSNLGRSLTEPSAIGDESGNDLEGDITATYGGVVSVGTDAPVGDIYTTLSIDLSNTLTGGLLSNNEWSFIADTDLLSVSGDLTESITPVPLPAGLLPLSIALLGLTAVARRKS